MEREHRKLWKPDGAVERYARMPTHELTGPVSHAFSALYLGYIVLPLVAGVDKFFHYIVDWNVYLAGPLAQLAGARVSGLMGLVGLVEITAGLLVAVRPGLGGLLVAAWLWVIVANLLIAGGYHDVALRDFGLSLGALALSRLAADLWR